MSSSLPTIDEYSSENVIKSTYAHYIIFGCSVASIAWGVVNTMAVSKSSQSLGQE